MIKISGITMVGNGNVITVGGSTINGNGVLVKEAREVDNFKEISVSGCIEVVYQPSAGISLSIEGEENIISQIKTEVKRGKLSIYSEEAYSPTKPIKVICSSPNMEWIKVSGSCSVDVEELWGGNINIDVSGNSRVDIEGGGNFLNATILGSSSMNASSYEAKESNIIASGTASAKVLTTHILRVNASGCANVKVKGNPSKQDVSTSGVAKVRV